MYLRESIRYGRIIKVIHPGEYLISNEDELIGTILGSCVSVCLHDPKNKMSGTNHYMLPGRISSSDIFKDRSAKYGITAIHNFINKMLKSDEERSSLIARVFGGGHVLESVSDANPDPKDNIRLALALLELEDLPIVQIDTG
ncbi:MAG: chemotaxis protein CheD [Spirochaetes bacterium]|nr:chemotaxis protein CheD [Spirochaetota bacterium]